VTQINAGQCIKRAQSLRGISCQQMAEDYGLHRQQVTRWRSQSDMHLGKLVSFAEYFEMNFFEFLKLGEQSDD